MKSKMKNVWWALFGLGMIALIIGSCLRTRFSIARIVVNTVFCAGGCNFSVVFRRVLLASRAVPRNEKTGTGE